MSYGSSTTPSYPFTTHPSTSGTPYSNSLLCGVFLKLRTLLYENFAIFLSLAPITTNMKYTSIQLSPSSKPCMRTPCEPFTATLRMITAFRWVIVWDYHHNRGVMLWIPLHPSLCLPFLSFCASRTSFVSAIITSRFYLSLCASLLGNTSEFQSLWRNLSVSRLRAHPVSTILCMFPHTADNSIIHLWTHLRLDLCLLVKSRPPTYTPRCSASTIIVLLIPLFGHHCGCIYLFVLSVIPYITQDSS